MPRAIGLLAILLAACGGNPSRPTGTPPPLTPTTPVATFTVSGTVTATNGGTPITTTLDYGIGTTTSDGGGRYAISGPVGTSTLVLRISGAGLIDRRTYLSTATHTANLDAIRDTGFDLTFYRQFVRNTFDAPTTMEPLRRWTRTPQIYLKTVDEAGEPIHGPTLDLIEATARAAVPEWTGNALGTPSIERGTGTRVGQSGWITIRFPAGAIDGRCGQAQVGVDGGWVELSYHQTASINCRTATTLIAPRTVRHELGHALGFWHVSLDATAALMSSGDWPQSVADMRPTTRELAHAAIAYRRPVGNTDPDVDPFTTINLAPMHVR